MGIASFKPGTWNGEEFDSAFIKQLVDNFQKYSTGQSPHYVPYVSINHNDALQAGRVSDARVGFGGVLSLDADDVPEDVGSWRNAGGLRQPSIEFFEPVYDAEGNLIDGFRRPDGSIEPTPVLKCLTLLGANAPAVKGLPDLPLATVKTYKHGGRVKRFSNPLGGTTPNANGVPTMDRTAILAALQALGMDVSGFTDAIPDPVLQSILEWAQKQQAGNPNPAPAPAPAPDVSQMADAATPTNIALPAIPGAAPGSPGAQPSQIVMKFADSTSARTMGAWLGAVNTMANQAAKTLHAVNATAQTQMNAAKEERVKRFVDSLATPDVQGMVRILPAQKPALVTMLMKCDSVTVKKFADGKTQGSELDEMQASILASYEKKPFKGEQLKDPGANQPGGGGAAVTGIDPEKRRQMLQATPQGRAVLARERAAGK